MTELLYDPAVLKNTCLIHANLFITKKIADILGLDLKAKIGLIDFLGLSKSQNFINNSSTGTGEYFTSSRAGCRAKSSRWRLALR